MHQFLYQRSTGNTMEIRDFEREKEFLEFERDDKLGQIDPSKYVLAQVVDPDRPKNVSDLWKGGKHLGAVREWIKNNCNNGSTVTWGSEQVLNGNFTVKNLERLASEIAFAVLKEKGLTK